MDYVRVHGRTKSIIATISKIIYFGVHFSNVPCWLHEVLDSGDEEMNLALSVSSVLLHYARSLLINDIGTWAHVGYNPLQNVSPFRDTTTKRVRLNAIKMWRDPFVLYMDLEYCIGCGMTRPQNGSRYCSDLCYYKSYNWDPITNSSVFKSESLSSDSVKSSTTVSLDELEHSQLPKSRSSHSHSLETSVLSAQCDAYFKTVDNSFSIRLYRKSRK
jgi:hypothetical protein